MRADGRLVKNRPGQTSLVRARTSRRAANATCPMCCGPADRAFRAVLVLVVARPHATKCNVFGGGGNLRPIPSRRTKRGVRRSDSPSAVAFEHGSREISSRRGRLIASSQHYFAVKSRRNAADRRFRAVLVLAVASAHATKCNVFEGGGNCFEGGGNC